MKGMSQTLVIVVTAIVILVAALVVITIFGGGVQQVASITQAQALCQTSATATCPISGQLPPTWYSNTVRVGDDPPTSCSSISTCKCTKNSDGTTYSLTGC